MSLLAAFLAVLTGVALPAPLSTQLLRVEGAIHDAHGHRYSYAVVFFRYRYAGQRQSGNVAPVEVLQPAIFAITDLEGGRFVSGERFARAPGTQSQSALPLTVATGNWALAQISEAEALLTVGADPYALSLHIALSRPPIRMPLGGLQDSLQLDDPVTGTLGVGGHTEAVSGVADVDTAQGRTLLRAGETGWDRFSVHLADGTRVIYNQIRAQDASATSSSSGILLSSHRRAEAFGPRDVVVEVRGKSHWTSAATGGSYPSLWRLTLPQASLDLALQPVIGAQEQVPRMGNPSWEGALEVNDVSTGDSAGYARAQLTGYAGPVLF